MSINQKGIPHFYTGDKVLMFASSKKVKSIQGVMDKSTISQWYSQDPERNHLGLVEMFGQMSKTQYGIMPELLKERQVLEVGDSGKFTYDVPVYEEDSCMTTRDTSDQPFPGRDGTTFKIILSEMFTAGDVLTYDVLHGDQLMVEEDDVIQVGDSFEHIVSSVSYTHLTLPTILLV